MKHAIHVVIISLLFIFPESAFSQEIDCTPQERLIFEEYVSYITPYKSDSKEFVLQKTAEFFLGNPYVAGTLDKSTKEKLVVNLREFDCVTYIETVIALADVAKTNELTFDDFSERLLKIRYRNAELNGYDSRLHYTSDWVRNNVENGILKPVILDNLVLETKPIDFMSTHRQAYAALKTDDEMLRKIQSVEDNINSRGGFYYLPKERIESDKDSIPHMAMIAFTTSIKGLDTTHTGFSYKKDGKLTFIHASSAKNNVVIDEKTLSDYCKKQKSCTGITVMLVR